MMQVTLKNARLGKKDFDILLAERLLNTLDSARKPLWELEDSKFKVENGKIIRARSKRKVKQAEK
jgi:hypothetical protein